METVGAFVAPGELTSGEKEGYMRAKGVREEDGALIATKAGIKVRLDRLLTIQNYFERYTPDTGDVVVGRVVSIDKSSWSVDIHASRLGQMNPSSIRLKDDVIRRRSMSDEINMRKLMKEGDIIAAEVQQVKTGGSIRLHCRSPHDRVLKHGIFVISPSCLVPRRSRHRFMIPSISVFVILGVNGGIWVGSCAADIYDRVVGKESSIDYGESAPSASRCRNVIIVASCIRNLIKNERLLTKSIIEMFIDIIIAEDNGKEEIIVLVEKCYSLLLDKEEEEEK
ncbi:Exosome complex RNA-binding protein 1/RRP40/RRP4 like protein [Aduncisulcus paluster]|uniref:Exosome complex RNA-binding protein 1/RRP40/RRP4 like protein n=1 Tax=Aduncisulcus paluster TaxID=2918883 RepID=A0ABQ5KRL7_9EUKA|nr:Exosome complex RNA-binding protein 1/RRP40/RRP4 like protein [Aduncisulcus paluster]